MSIVGLLNLVVRHKKAFFLLFVAVTIFGGLTYIRIIKNELANLEQSLAISEANLAQERKEKELSREVSKKYQADLSALNRDLERLRQLPPSCIPIESTTGHNGSTTGAKFSKGNGVRSGWLYEYAGRAESTRLRLLGCQQYVRGLDGVVD